jgi:hypothetical protein
MSCARYVFVCICDHSAFCLNRHSNELRADYRTSDANETSVLERTGFKRQIDD